MVENAGHGSSIFENQPLYEQTEKEFLADALGAEADKKIQQGK